MIKTRWTGPGGSLIRFHIRVVRKDFTTGVNRKIVGIAKPAGNQFNLFALGITTENKTTRRFDTRRVTARILEFRLEQISFVIMLVRTRRISLRLKLRMVTDHSVNQTVRSKHQSMRTVLNVFPFELQQQFYFVEKSVLV